jgi:hypothetical protein
MISFTDAATCPNPNQPALRVADPPLDCVSVDTIVLLNGRIRLLNGLSTGVSIPI